MYHYNPETDEDWWTLQEAIDEALASVDDDERAAAHAYLATSLDDESPFDF